MAGFLAGIMTSPRHGKSPLRLYTFAGYNAQILSRDTIVDSIKRNFEFHHRGISLATGWCLDRCKTRSLDKTVRFYNVQAGIDRFVVGFRTYSLPYSILPRIVYLIYELVIGRSVIKYRASDILRTLENFHGTISFEFLRLAKLGYYEKEYVSRDFVDDIILSDRS